MAQWCELRFTSEIARRKKLLSEHGVNDAAELSERVPLRYSTAVAYMNGEYVSENTVQKIYNALTDSRFKVRGRRYLKINRRLVDDALGTRNPYVLTFKNRGLTMYMAKQMLNRDELSPRTYKKLCEITKTTPGAFLVFE